MKKAVRIVLILIGIIVLGVIGLGTFVQFSSIPSYPDVPILDINVPMDSLTLVQGKKLIDHDCAGCHRAGNGKYEGKFFEDLNAHETFGTIYTSNITQDDETGIGTYSEGELYRLLRTGIKKNGQIMLPIMPIWVSAADEDIYAMIAFLKSSDSSVQPSSKKHPTYEPSFLAKALTNFVVMPFPYKDQYPQKPALSDSVAYGAYMVNASYGCYLCHSASLETWDLENPTMTPNYLGGGAEFNMGDYTVVGPSLLMDGQSNVSDWTIDEFVDAVKYGQLPNDQPGYRLPMHPYPLLDTAEVRAIYHYLKEVGSK